jgi:hypothetical protein
MYDFFPSPGYPQVGERFMIIDAEIAEPNLQWLGSEPERVE